MTYKELIDRLNSTLTENQLNMEAMVFDFDIDEFFPVKNLVVVQRTSANLDDNQPVLVIAE